MSRPIRSLIVALLVLAGAAVGVPASAVAAPACFVVHHPAHDQRGRAIRTGPVAVTGHRTLRSVVAAGSFEGHTTLGVGTRARVSYRVTVLPGPGPGTHSRLVLDVAHGWR